jgi:hypothetical protein
MTQKDFPNRMANLSKGGVVQAEHLGRFQADLFEKIQEVNRHWLERVQLEATLAAEFARKMARYVHSPMRRPFIRNGRADR